MALTPQLIPKLENILASAETDDKDDQNRN